MITYSNLYVTFENKNNKKVMLVEAEGEGKFKHVAYQKDAPWTNNLHAYTGEYYCPELKTSYQFSINNDKLIIQNPRTGNVEFTPTLKDGFTGNRRYFNEVKFVRDNNQELNGFYLSTYTGDKFWFEKEQVSLARNTSMN